MNLHRSVARLAALFTVVAALAAQATTTTITCKADTTLYEDATGSLANGAGSALFCGVISFGSVRRAVVQFDVANALPAGARVVAAELRLRVAQSNVVTPVAMSAHRVLADWSEGTTNAGLGQGQGTAAAPGDATWLHRNYPSLLWTAPGGDYDALASGVAATPQTGAAVWSSTNRMIADVQSWLDAPLANYGWLLRTDELVPQEVRRMDSRTATTAANRPQLVVTWILPGQWTALGAGCGAPAPSLAASGTIQLGGNLAWTLNGTPGLLAATLFANDFVQPGALVAPGCSFFLPLGAVTPGLHLLDASGNATDAFVVPNIPLFAGYPMAAQGAVLDANQALGFALSNAALAIVQ